MSGWPGVGLIKLGKRRHWYQETLAQTPGFLIVMLVTGITSNSLNCFRKFFVMSFWQSEWLT